jgi:hypothetical protein
VYVARHGETTCARHVSECFTELNFANVFTSFLRERTTLANSPVLACSLKIDPAWPTGIMENMSVRGSEYPRWVSWMASLSGRLPRKRIPRRSGGPRRTKCVPGTFCARVDLLNPKRRLQLAATPVSTAVIRSLCRLSQKSNFARPPLPRAIGCPCGAARDRLCPALQTALPAGYGWRGSLQLHSIWLHGLPRPRPAADGHERRRRLEVFGIGEVEHTR